LNALGERPEFSGPDDLDHHYKQVHSSAEDADDAACDYGWKKSTEPFTKKDHYRDHLRDYRWDDIGSSNGPMLNYGACIKSMKSKGAPYSFSGNDDWTTHEHMDGFLPLCTIIPIMAFASCCMEICVSSLNEEGRLYHPSAFMKWVSNSASHFGYMAGEN